MPFITALRRVIYYCVVFVVVILGGACSGGGSGSISTPNPTITSVTVSPTSASAAYVTTVQFSDTVAGTGSYSSAVTWSASDGTIDQKGLFTAPSKSETVTITATSTEDASKSGTATVTVTQPGSITAVSVSCSPTLITANQIAQCTAQVEGKGTFDSDVVWSTSGGAITGGVYTPPAVTSYTTETITATSAQDVTKSGTYSLPVQRRPPAGTWQAIGPPGAAVMVIAADPTHPNTVYAGTSLGLVGSFWKSTNGGANWNLVTTGTWMDRVPISDILILDNGQTIVTGGGYQTCKSTDGGNTWTQLSLPVTSAQVGYPLVGALAVNPQNTNVIYLSGRNYGVLKSTDEGSTWTLLPGSPTSKMLVHNALQVDPTNPSVIYLGTDNGLYISSDAGATWVASTNGIATADTAIWDLAVDPANPSNIFLLAANPSLPLTDLYVSVNRGASWTALAQYQDAQRVVPDTTNPQIIYLVGLQVHAVYRSTDGGDTFAASDNGMPTLGNSQDFIMITGPSAVMIIVPGNPETFYSTEWNPYKSTDGQNWTLAIQGMSAYYGAGVAVDPLNQDTIYYTTLNGGGSFKSADGGTSWTQLTLRDAFSIAVDPFDSNHIFANGASGLAVSNDGGNTWNDITGRLPSPQTGIPYSVGIQGLSFSPIFANLFFVTTQNSGVLLSNDGGASFAASNAGLATFICFTPVIADSTAPQTVFVGTDSGIFISTNSGGTWQLASNFGGDQSVTALAIDTQAVPSALYATTMQSTSPWTLGLYKSTDNGKTWSKLSRAGSVIVDPTSANSLFLFAPPYDTGFGQVYWSPDGGQSWTQITDSVGLVLDGFNGRDWGYAITNMQPEAVLPLARAGRCTGT